MADASRQDSLYLSSLSFSFHFNWMKAEIPPNES